MFKYFNPNPMNKRVGDCVIRAISRALDWEWNDTYTALCLQGYVMSDLPSSNQIWGAFLRKQGFIRQVIPNECPDCYTVEDFCKDHPTGIYVLGTGSHAVAVVDGFYYDAWESGREQPIYYYEKGE
jgi:hypothetical protein